MWDFEVIHDGVALKASVLIEMAMNASDYRTAEHYIVSLMFGAVDHKDLSLIHKCLEICEHHGVLHFREYKNLVMSYRFISEDKLRLCQSCLFYYLKKLLICSYPINQEESETIIR